MSAARYICAFQIHRKGAAGKTWYLACRVSWNASRSYIRLAMGYAIDPDRWDPVAQRCRPRSFHGVQRVPASVINADIEAASRKVGELFDGYGLDLPDDEVVKADLRALFGSGSGAPRNVVQVTGEFITEGITRSGWTESTVKKFRTVFRHMAAYAPFKTFKGFREKDLLGYVEFLRDERHLNNTTIHRQLGYLRWFLKWAAGKGWLACRDYEDFRPRLRQSVRPVIFLTWEELGRVTAYRGPAYKEQVRDMFLFGAYTSLRWSDIQDLRWSSVGDGVIHVTTRKTGDPLTIELSRKASAILDEYVDAGYPEDRVFPAVPNQVANRYLKEIMKDCGIDEPVTVTEYRAGERTDAVHPKWELVGTHAARRSFICHALSLGIAPTVVMEWTGHSDYEAMKPYIAVTDRTRRRAMDLFDTEDGEDTKTAPQDGEL